MQKKRRKMYSKLVVQYSEELEPIDNQSTLMCEDSELTEELQSHQTVTSPTDTYSLSHHKIPAKQAKVLANQDRPTSYYSMADSAYCSTRDSTLSHPSPENKDSYTVNEDCIQELDTLPSCTNHKQIVSIISLYLVLFQSVGRGFDHSEMPCMDTCDCLQTLLCYKALESF